MLSVGHSASKECLTKIVPRLIKRLWILEVIFLFLTTLAKKLDIFECNA